MLKKIAHSCAAILFTCCFNAQATIVEFQTSHGNFKVNLYDEGTPKTVENFLNYVTDEDYNNTIVHRVEPNFVMQAGGYYYDGTPPIKEIATDSSVINEPVYSNVRGTIAMAKLSGNPNSATSQWFINLKDNSSSGATLDTQNGGFTVFGEVIEDGMTTVDAISSLTLCDSIPMTDAYSATDCANNEIPAAENFVTIYTIVIYDSTVASAAGLSPARNTLINQTSGGSNSSSSSSGGSTTGCLILMLALCFGARKR